MASSNIKLFDENKGNMLNDTEFNISTQRLNGLQTGVASSQLQNKAMYQASLMAYSIAQLMLANGKDANDTDAVSTFVNNLLASIVQKVADKATKQDIKNGVSGKWIPSELFKSNNEDIANAYLKLAGGTMTGDLILNRDPISSLQAATKQYVDGKLVIKTFTCAGNDPSFDLGFKPYLWVLPQKNNIAYDRWWEDSTDILIIDRLKSNVEEVFYYGFSGGSKSVTLEFDGNTLYIKDGATINATGAFTAFIGIKS